MHHFPTNDLQDGLEVVVVLVCMEEVGVLDCSTVASFALYLRWTDMDYNEIK